MLQCNQCNMLMYEYGLDESLVKSSSMYHGPVQVKHFSDCPCAMEEGRPTVVKSEFLPDPPRGSLLTTTNYLFAIASALGFFIAFMTVQYLTGTPTPTTINQVK